LNIDENGQKPSYLVVPDFTVFKL